MASAETAVPMAVEQGCHDGDPSDESAICAAHCSQDDLSGKAERIPPIPTLLPSLAVGFSSIAVLDADRPRCVELPPAVSWHRPTTHPASLLLI